MKGNWFFGLARAYQTRVEFFIVRQVNPKNWYIDELLMAGNLSPKLHIIFSFSIYLFKFMEYVKFKIVIILCWL